MFTLFPVIVAVEAWLAMTAWFRSSVSSRCLLLERWQRFSLFSSKIQIYIYLPFYSILSSLCRSIHNFWFSVIWLKNIIFSFFFMSLIHKTVLHCHIYNFFGWKSLIVWASIMECFDYSLINLVSVALFFWWYGGSVRKFFSNLF